jgi:hypothetical protein
LTDSELGAYRTSDELLDPLLDAARVRAIVVHLEWARRGIRLSIVQACEQPILDAGFHKMDIVATLAGNENNVTRILARRTYCSPNIP